MRHTQYAVWFTNGSYEPQCIMVSALKEGDAIILAKAERIKDGLDHTLHKLEAVE